MRRIRRLLRTLYYLNFTQIKWRLIYKVNPPHYKGLSKQADCQGYKLAFSRKNTAPSQFVINTRNGTWTFAFLNQEKHFSNNKVDWNYSANGKLWNYNLNYFEFLLQEDLDESIKQDLLDQFIHADLVITDGLEPYPISLRAINWIRYFSQKNELYNQKYSKYLFSHLSHLEHSLEYHLLGNHLLENGFALLMGSYYFKNDRWYQLAKEILQEELVEQLELDGAHFELSPMYHSIIFYRILEAIDLLINNKWKEDKLLTFLQSKASLMLCWLQNITFSNGDLPMVNDAAPGITFTSGELQDYALHLKIEPAFLPLKQSGYRLWKKGNWEVFIDVAPIAVDYQPGHAHADTFSFILYHRQIPVIVDTATSTYEKDELRQSERRTNAHNTVAYGGDDSSEVYGGFRVGRRAKVKLLSEKDFWIKAIHNGYKNQGVSHQRIFDLHDNTLLIEDSIKGNVRKKSITNIHFHPGCEVSLKGNKLLVNNSLTIKFENTEEIKLGNYFFAEGFNRRVKSSKITGTFINTSKIYIYEN